MMEEDLMTRLEFALDSLPKWQEDVLLYDAENNFNDRNQLLLDNVGITSQKEINTYVNRLKNKVKELVQTGKYEEKHKGNSKPTLKGF